MDDMTYIFILLMGVGIILFCLFYGMPLLFSSIVRDIIAEEHEAAITQAGLRPIDPSILPLVVKRFQSLLQFPEGEYPGPETQRAVFKIRVGAHDAYLCEWSHSIFGSYRIGRSVWNLLWTPTLAYRAYIVLGPRAPVFRVVPKTEFQHPEKPLEISEDPAFSKVFWIAADDKECVRRFLAPELCQFLLEQGKDCRFHAGPDGVALVRKLRASKAEASEAPAILERLAALAETAARR